MHINVYINEYLLFECYLPKTKETTPEMCFCTFRIRIVKGVRKGGKTMKKGIIFQKVSDPSDIAIVVPVYKFNYCVK